MAIRWEWDRDDGVSGGAVDGYDPDGRVACRVVHHSSGWHAYLRGDPVDDVDYDLEGAQAAAVRAWLADPEPPAKRSTQRRRFVRNTGPEGAPHPGDLAG